MQRGSWIVVLLAGLAGCATEAGDWDLTRVEKDAVTRSGNAANAGDEGEDGFDFDAYKDEQAEADAAASAEAADPDALVEGLGAEGVDVPEDSAPAPAAPTDMAEALGVPAAPASPVAPAAAARAPAWTPDSAVSLSWGLRLLSTVDAASPPRAILGLPDGSEEVVRAGDMLPEQGVVVLAVGRGVVQLGQVQPQGDHVEVESVFLRAMFPGEGVAP